MADDDPYAALIPQSNKLRPDVLGDDADPFLALIPPASGKFSGVTAKIDSTSPLGEYTPEEIAALEAEAAALPATASPLGEAPATTVRFSSPMVSYDELGTPDYSAALNSSEGGLGEVLMRGLFGRGPDIVANMIEAPATVNEAVIRATGATPSDTGLFAGMRGLLRKGAGAIRELGYTSDMDAVGYGNPTVSGAEVVDAINPASGMGLGDRAGAVGTFIPETLAGSVTDMAATLNPLTLAGYMTSRTNEVAKNRAANDNRADVTLGDVGIAAPAAVLEGLLERFTTMRLLPHGTTLATPGARAAITRIAKELGLQGSLGGVEEVVPYLAEGAGTEAGVSPEGALQTFVGGALAEGVLGGGAQGIKEAAAVARLSHIPTAAAPPNAQPRAEAAPAEQAPPISDVAPAPLGQIEDTSDIDSMLQSVLGDPEIASALGLPPSTSPADAVLGTPVAASAPGGVVATPDPDSAFRRPEPESAPVATPSPVVDPPVQLPEQTLLPDLGEQTTEESVQALPTQSAPAVGSADLMQAVSAAREAAKAAPRAQVAPVAQEVTASDSPIEVASEVVDDTPDPPAQIAFGKRRASEAAVGDTARAQARVNRMFPDELDSTNPYVETRTEGETTFKENRLTREAIDTALAAPEDKAGTLLRSIASQDGIRPEQKWLAEKLAPILKDLDVKLVEPPPAEKANYGGAYNNLRNELWVRQAAPTIALHEALHGATSSLLTYKAGQSANPALGRVRQEFDDMLGHLRQHVETIGIDNAPAEVQKYLRNAQGPLANVKELLSYGMTERPFQEYLQTVPAPPNRSGWRTMWDAFKSAIRATLGGDKLTPDQRTFLDALIESTGELVDFAEANPGVAKIAQKSEAAKIARAQYARASGVDAAAVSEDDPAQIRTPADAEQEAEIKRNAVAGTLPVSRGSPGWNYDSSAWEGRKGELNRARTQLQDKMLPWREAQNQIESQLQAALPDAQNVYRIENLMHGRVSEGIDRIERDQIVPLVDAMKARQVKPAELEEYLYARHAKERNAQIAEINSKMPDGGSGMTNAEADKILAAADKEKLDPLAKRVDAITRSTRKRLLDSGLITQEQFDAMQGQYAAYVPLRGKATSETDFDAGSGGGAGRGVDSRAQPVKAAMGRGAGNRAVNILGEVIGDAQRSVIVAEKARVGRAVMRIVLANPNPNLWTVEPVQTERKTDANGEVYDAVVNDWSDPSIVAVRHKGKLYKVEIQNQPMAQALNNVGIDQLGSVTRAAGAINRYLSAVLTKYNPAFVPVNATRDALFGLTGLAVEKGEAVALEAALSYPKAAIAAGRSAANKPGSGDWDEFAKEFAEAGGKTGYVNAPSAEDLSRKIGSGKLTSYSPDGLMKAARAIGDAIEVLNDAVENALRLSAYGTLRKRGESVDAAAEYAKNLTVNFNRKGLSGSKLNAWFLFYNAALQGAHRTSKLLRKPKTYSYLGALAGAQVIATMAAMGMEDDNGEPLWNKIPDHVKRRNLVIPLPSGHIITVPMPYGFNLFTYMAGRMAGALANNQRGDDRPSETAGAITADLMSAATESFLPVPLGDGAMGMLPTVLRVPVNVQTNRDDFGRPIRDENAYGKSDVPRASMGKPDTLELFKITATGLNRLGGGDDLTPPAMSWFDRAPEDLEYLLGEVTGGTGQFIVDTAKGIQKVTGDDPMTMRDMPITKRFATAVDEQAAQAAMFYDRRESIDRSLKRVRILFEQDGEEAAEAMLKAAPELKGAAFKRRKGEGKKGQPVGSVILVDGRPQIVVGDEEAVYGRYKAAEKAITERNEAVEAAYANAPKSIIPTAGTRERDASIRTSNDIREAAQSAFNEAWVRDVVGAAE